MISAPEPAGGVQYSDTEVWFPNGEMYEISRVGAPGAVAVAVSMRRSVAGALPRLATLANVGRLDRMELALKHAPVPPPSRQRANSLSTGTGSAECANTPNEDGCGASAVGVVGVGAPGNSTVAVRRESHATRLTAAI